MPATGSCLSQAKWNDTVDKRVPFALPWPYCITHWTVVNRRQRPQATHSITLTTRRVYMVQTIFTLATGNALWQLWIKIKANQCSFSPSLPRLCECAIFHIFFFYFLCVLGDYWKHGCMSFWAIKYIGGGCQKHQIFTTSREPRRKSSGTRERDSLYQPSI